MLNSFLCLKYNTRQILEPKAWQTLENVSEKNLEHLRAIIWEH